MPGGVPMVRAAGPGLRRGDTYLRQKTLALRPGGPRVRGPARTVRGGGPRGRAATSTPRPSARRRPGTRAAAGVGGFHPVGSSWGRGGTMLSLGAASGGVGRTTKHAPWRPRTAIMPERLVPRRPPGIRPRHRRGGRVVTWRRRHGSGSRGRSGRDGGCGRLRDDRHADRHRNKHRGGERESWHGGGLSYATSVPARRRSIAQH